MVFLSGRYRRAPFWRIGLVIDLVTVEPGSNTWGDRHQVPPRPVELGLIEEMCLVSQIISRGFSFRVNVTVIDKIGQATKGVWWMSWHREATKDVVACDKPREAGKQALIRGFLNEETQLG